MVMLAVVMELFRYYQLMRPNESYTNCSFSTVMLGSRTVRAGTAMCSLYTKITTRGVTQVHQCDWSSLLRRFPSAAGNCGCVV